MSQKKLIEEQLNILKYAASGAHDQQQSRLKGTRNPLDTPRRVHLEQFAEQRAGAMMFNIQNPNQTYLATTNTTKNSLVKDPTTRDASQLKPILIKDLIVETIHTDRVIIARTITQCFKMNAIQLLIEDQNGGDRESMVISLYNVALPKGGNPMTHADAMFPVGIIFAIKEPYFKLAVSGILCIRIDNPQDLEFITNPNHVHLYNESWKQSIRKKLPKDIDGEDGWRLRGNKYYTNGDYERAIEHYDGGLAIDPEHSILSLNKLAALLSLKRYHECIPIGILLLLKLPNNEKLYSRLGRAYHHVGLYEKSIEYFEMVLKISENNKEALEYTKKVKDRINERDHGKFDFESIRNQFKSSGEVDCSEYFGPITIIDVPGMGRGLAVTKDIETGTLLIVSKGIGVCEKDTRNVVYDANLKDKSINDTSHVKMLALVNKTIKSNPLIAGQLSKLYNGEAKKSINDPDKIQLNDFRIDESKLLNFNNQNQTKAISVDQIGKVISFNSFRDDLNESSGLWFLPSLINHACLSNITRFCIGDMMFLTTTKNLKAGEELLTLYTPFESSFNERTSIFNNFGFTCSCQLCNYDRTESKKNQEERNRLKNDFTENLGKKIKSFDVKLIPAVEKHIEAVKKTYTLGRPLELELFHPMTGLALLYQAQSHEKALNAYIECLHITGFDMDIKRSKAKLSKDPINFRIKYEGALQHNHTDLFMHICSHANALGYETLARQSLALSRLSGRINEGLSVKEHNTRYKSFQSKNLFHCNDTIQIIN